MDVLKLREIINIFSKGLQEYRAKYGEDELFQKAFIFYKSGLSDWIDYEHDIPRPPAKLNRVICEAIVQYLEARRAPRMLPFETSLRASDSKEGSLG